MTITSFSAEYLKKFPNAKAFIDDYRNLHKYPATIGKGKDEKTHPKAGQVNRDAVTNKMSDAELQAVWNEVYEPAEGMVIDRNASQELDEE